MYWSILSLTSALDGVSGQRHAPAVLVPGKTRYPLHRKLGAHQGRCGLVRKNLTPTWIRSPNRPSPYRVAIPTELPQTTVLVLNGNGYEMICGNFIANQVYPFTANVRVCGILCVCLSNKLRYLNSRDLNSDLS